MDWSPTGLGGLGLVAAAAVALVRYLLSDKSVSITHQEQIAALNRRCAALEQDLAEVRVDTEHQHRLKHAIRTELAVTVLLLTFGRRAAVKCGCGEMDAFAEMVPSVVKKAIAVADLDVPIPSEEP